MDENMKDGRGRLPPLAVILVCAFCVRAAGIFWGLPNWNHTNSYNCDEYTTLTALQHMEPSAWRFNPVSDKDPYALAGGTLHLYSYGAWIKTLSLAGYITLVKDKAFYYRNPAEWGKFFAAGRFQSVLYGTLTVWAAYLVALRLYGARAALLSALLTAFMPALSVYSRYMVANARGLFWIVLSFYLLLRLTGRGRTVDYLAAGAAVGAAIAPRYSAAPLVFVAAAAHFMGPAPEKIKKPVLALLALAAVFLITTPYAVLDYPNFSKGVGAVKSLAGGGPGFFAGAAKVPAQFAEAMGVFPLFICLSGVAAAALRPERRDILPLLWTLPMLAIFLKAGPASIPGRILPVLPFFAIFGARALDLAWKRRPVLAKTALAAAALQSFLFYRGEFALMFSEDIRDKASGWLAGNVKQGASIGLVREPSWFGPGIIDRHYRHPDHALLPGVRFVRLTDGDWSLKTGFDLLEREKPDLVVLTDVEAGFLDKGKLLSKLAETGYSPAADFNKMFRPAWPYPGASMPRMLFMTERVEIFSRNGGGLERRGGGRGAYDR